MTSYGPADARVGITSCDDKIAAWMERLFSPWWKPKDDPAPADEPTAYLSAHVDPRHYEEIADTVAGNGTSPAQGHYGGSRLLSTVGPDGTVYAVAQGDGIAYQVSGSAVTVVGQGSTHVALAACRTVRHIVRGLMENGGYTLLRASSATIGGKALLTFAGGGADEARNALLLASRHYLGLQGTACVFARADAGGTITLRPFVNAVGLPLRLLDDLGWSRTVVDRHWDGDLYPAQHPDVTSTLTERRATPFGPLDRNLKVQMWPVQLRHWFGLDLTHYGTAAAVLTAPDTFPSADTAPPENSLRRSARMLAALAGRDDPLGLRPPGTNDITAAQNRLHQALEQLPRHCVDPTRGQEAHAEALGLIAASL